MSEKNNFPQQRFLNKYKPINSSLAFRYQSPASLPPTKIKVTASPRYLIFNPKKSLTPRLQLIDTSFRELLGQTSIIKQDFYQLDYMYRRYRIITDHQQLINQSFSRKEQDKMLKDIKDFIPTPRKKQKVFFTTKSTREKIERDFPIFQQ